MVLHDTYGEGGHHRTRGRVFALGYRREDGKFSPLFLLIFDFALRGRFVEGLVGNEHLGRLEGWWNMSNGGGWLFSCLGSCMKAL